MFSWQHISVLGIGAALAVAGALIPGGQVTLLPLGTTIVGGVLGAVQASKKDEKK
jgi:hypothetical protein